MKMITSNVTVIGSHKNLFLIFAACNWEFQYRCKCEDFGLTEIFLPAKERNRFLILNLRNVVP